MSSEAVQKQLKRAAEGAGINEDRVYVHCFRHARVTYMKKSPEYVDMDIEHTLDWSEGSNQMKRYSHLTQEDKIASVLQARGIEAESGNVEPELMGCPRCGRDIPYDARNCPYCSVRVDSRPADWYQLYSDLLIAPEEDPLYQKYAGMSSTTPSIQRLPREQFGWVRAVFRSLLAERLGPEGPSGPHDEIMDVIDTNNLSEEEVEEVEQLYLSTGLKENYQLHQADYELAENEEFLEWLRGESLENEDLTGTEYMEQLYGSTRD